MPKTITPTSIRPVGEHVSLKQQALPARYAGFSEQYVGSGTMALQYAVQQIKAQHRHPRCEIMLPAYACPDLVSACIGAGVTPILVDLGPNSPFPSLDAIKDKLTQHSAGVILINFLGLSPPKRLFDDISALGLMTIEDRAQSFEPAHEAGKLLGDYVIFSFGKGKPVSLLGGGLCLSRSANTATDATEQKSNTSDSKIPWTFRLKASLYNLVIQPFFYYCLLKVPGLSIGETHYKAPEPIENLPAFKHHLIRANIGRQHAINQNAQDQLTQAAAAKGLHSFGSAPYEQRLLRLPFLAPNKQHRDTVLTQLNASGIGASAMYNTPLPNIKGTPLDSAQREAAYPNALDFADRLITLPCHSGVRGPAFKRILSALADTQISN